MRLPCSTWHPVLIYSFDLICSHPLINKNKTLFIEARICCNQRLEECLISQKIVRCFVIWLSKNWIMCNMLFIQKGCVAVYLLFALCCVHYCYYFMKWNSSITDLCASWSIENCCVANGNIKWNFIHGPYFEDGKCICNVHM